MILGIFYDTVKGPILNYFKSSASFCDYLFDRQLLALFMILGFAYKYGLLKPSAISILIRNYISFLGNAADNSLGGRMWQGPCNGEQELSAGSYLYGNNDSTSIGFKKRNNFEISTLTAGAKAGI